jgi:hypothetical protein
VLLVGIAVITASLNGMLFVFTPGNFGWGAW